MIIFGIFRKIVIDNRSKYGDNSEEKRDHYREISGAGELENQAVHAA
jgi:hypothetical protein